MVQKTSNSSLRTEQEKQTITVSALMEQLPYFLLIAQICSALPPSWRLCSITRPLQHQLIFKVSFFSRWKNLRRRTSCSLGKSWTWSTKFTLFPMYDCKSISISGIEPPQVSKVPLDTPEGGNLDM